MPVKKDSPRGLSHFQRSRIFVECNQTARDLGLDPDEYRHRIMMEELGIHSLTVCNRTSDFDKLMQRILSDRGDYSRALEFVGGDVKRLAFLAKESARKILVDKGADETDVSFEFNALRYVASVMIQMRMSSLTVDALAFKLRMNDGWDDFTPIQLKNVVSSLNVHLRRKR